MNGLQIPTRCSNGLPRRDHRLTKSRFTPAKADRPGVPLTERCANGNAPVLNHSPSEFSSISRAMTRTFHNVKDVLENRRRWT